MDTFDPDWLKEGVFSVGGDGRPTRTQRVRDELNRLEQATFSMPRLRDQGRPATAYYFREGSHSDVEAQYYMIADRDLRTLGLGLSVEKGEEGKSASADRRMDRKAWDWPRLVALGEDALTGHIAAISKQLDHPVSVIVDYHRPDRDDEDGDHLSGPYTFVGRWWKRGAPSSARDVVERLREVDRLKDWWADVWIIADYNQSEVAEMLPEQVARNLHAFKPLRDALRGRRT